jgi:hypothetical protein
MMQSWVYFIPIIVLHAHWNVLTKLTQLIVQIHYLSLTQGQKSSQTLHHGSGNAQVIAQQQTRLGTNAMYFLKGPCAPGRTISFLGPTFHSRAQ